MSDASSEVFTPPPYADARALLLRAIEPFRPPRRISVADYAARREIRNPGGGYSGRWTDDEAPYLRGPQEALTSRLYTTTCIVGPGQCGKTEVAHNWMFHSVGTDPADFLWYMQTDRVMRDQVKDRVDRNIEVNDILADRLMPDSTSNTQQYKRFRGMSVHFMVAAPSNLISRAAPRIVVDEIDAFDPSVGGIMTQLDVRRSTFGRESMILAISHPDRASGLSAAGWQAGIMQVYARSTRGKWWWRCPHCGAVSSPNPTAERVTALHYDPEAPIEEIRRQARLLCPSNGCLIEDGERRAMNIAALREWGGWVHSGQTIDEDGKIEGEPIRTDVAGYWIVGAMSTLAAGGIGDLAASLVEAQRSLAVGADDAAEANLRDVHTKKLGIPYTPPRRIGSIDAEAIADRAEPIPLGIAQPGVRFVTAFADVQGNRFEMMFRGWGVRGESWILAYEQMPADPTTSPADWDRMLERLTGATFPLADGSGRALPVRAAGYDLGGAPGTTAQAYDAWRRWRIARRVRMLGQVSGRDVWTLLPMKGMGGPNAPRLAVTTPDAQRKPGSVRSGLVPQAQFNANTFKDDLAGQLATASAGPWMVHFPEALRSPAPPHAFFAGLVAEERQANGVWKHTKSARNEPLDLMVGCHVVAHLHGLPRIDWDRPPAWAADWEANALLTAAAAGPVATSPVVAARATPPAQPAPRGIIGQGRSLS